MASVRLKYKAVISDNIAVTAVGRFYTKDDLWKADCCQWVESAIVTLHGKGHDLKASMYDSLWMDTWLFEVRQLLKEDDHDLLWQLNAAAEQQKHEGAV